LPVLRPESWAVLVTAAAGIAAAVIAFAKTPADQRLRVRRRSLEERRAACPPDERAVIIPRDWRRALRRDLPWLLATLPILAFGMWFESTQGEPCASLFGMGRTRLAVLSLGILAPLVAIAACVQCVLQVRAVLRDGYWPPRDTAQYVDTLARAGRPARCHATAVVAALVLLLGVLGWGAVQVAGFVGQGKLWEKLAASEAACVRADGA
jgi:hypothetical protein